MYHSKKIGVFISHIFGEYQQNLCQGILDTAAEFGYLVEIFASTDGENLGTLPGEEGILKIPSFQDFSGIILAAGTYLDQELLHRIQTHIRRMSSCPVVTISQDQNDAANVVLDNNTPFAELMEHFLTVHRHKRICYLGCQPEADTSTARLDIYQTALEQHHITCQKQDIYLTDYGLDNAKTALDYFCRPGIPDAVVCYNDRMALDLMLAASQSGLNIPEDIAVSGCDNLELSQNITPTLTTITFPTYELGKEAIHKLIRMLDVTACHTPSIIRATPKIGCSCGCHYRVSNMPYYAITQMHEIAAKERRIYNDIHMSAALHEITDIDEGMELVCHYIQDIQHCSELYICLYEGWDNAPRRIQLLAAIEDASEAETPLKEPEEAYASQDTSLLLKLGYCKGQEIPPCSFSRRAILPDYIMNGTGSDYICAPLYFKDKSYGYVVLAFEDNKINYDFHVTSWINNISRMLKRIADNKHMMLLVNRLEDIYMRDELTGLYNYRGFRSMSDMLVSDVIASGSTLFAASVDINGLKHINDSYGRAEGNFVVQVVAGALNSISDDTAVTARTGGDEFCILAAGYDKAQADTCIANIRKYLDNYNRLHNKPYTITISCGYSLSPAANYEQLDSLLRNADQAMYLDKKAQS